MGKSEFFDSIRPLFNGHLSATQVTGMDMILDEGKRLKVEENALAYCLATAFYETAETMQPIHERGSKSYFNKYEPGTSIGKALGNTQPGDGFKYRGRGFVQLTGRRNYALAGAKLGINLLGDPDLALVPSVAAQVMFDGMEAGWFTGKGLDDYIDDKDEADSEDLREFIAARKIINGTDKAQLIGGYALKFEAALKCLA